MKYLSAAALMVATLGACSTQTPPDTLDLERRIRAVNDVLLRQGEIDRVPEFFSESYVSHGINGEARGHAAIQDYLTALQTAFPDLEIEVEVLVQQGQRVTWLRTHRGTHQGEFRGLPASGRTLAWQDMVVTRYENGLIAEEWAVSGLGLEPGTP